MSRCLDKLEQVLRSLNNLGSDSKKHDENAQKSCSLATLARIQSPAAAAGVVAGFCADACPLTPGRIAVDPELSPNNPRLGDAKC